MEAAGIGKYLSIVRVLDCGVTDSGLEEGMVPTGEENSWDNAISSQETMAVRNNQPPKNISNPRHCRIASITPGNYLHKLRKFSIRWAPIYNCWNANRRFSLQQPSTIPVSRYCQLPNNQRIF